MDRVKSLIWIFSAVLAWCAASADPVMDRSALLEVARENLRVTEAAERRVSDEYESLYTAGALNGEEIEEYQGFLQRIRRFVERYRLEVAVLSGVVLAGEGDEASVTHREDLSRSFSGEQTDEEQTGALDSELNASLGDFDEMLLREQEELAEKARTAEAAGGGGGGAGGASGGGQGFAGDAGAASETFATQGDTSEGAPGTAAEAESGERRVAAAGGYSKTAQREGSSPPADIPDGSDDDIVARQLREAAENEADPKLREKLWDEYRKYKNATQ